MLAWGLFDILVDRLLWLDRGRTENFNLCIIASVAAARSQLRLLQWPDMRRFIVLFVLQRH